MAPKPYTIDITELIPDWASTDDMKASLAGDIHSLLKSLLDPNNGSGVSNTLMDVLHRAPWTPAWEWDSDMRGFMIEQLKGLSALFQLVADLGELEHTSDWDPWLRITVNLTRKGKPIDYNLDTTSGYFLFEVTEDAMVIEAPDPEDMEDQEYLWYDPAQSRWVIPFNNIKSIQIFE